VPEDFNFPSESEDSEDSGDDAEQPHDLPVSDHTNPLHPIADRARPLNAKQFLVVKKILSRAIQHRGKITLEAEDQMLLAVAGEGGVGKTRVIQAVELSNSSNGLLSYNIDGRTIHTALGVDVFDRARQGKTTLFIDEISMVSLTMLNTINEQCNNIRALPQDSTAILGALPIVVFMGDFHQFAPIKAQPLWQTPKNPRAVFGQLVWHRFSDAIILDEQMRQHDDPDFQGLLHRARTGTITAADVSALNEWVMQSLPPCDGLDSVCVTRTNKRRHHINRLQMRRFAEARGQAPIPPVRPKRRAVHLFPSLRTLPTRGGQAPALPGDPKGLHPRLCLYLPRQSGEYVDQETSSSHVSCLRPDGVQGAGVDLPERGA
jgi:AAA domain